MRLACAICSRCTTTRQADALIDDVHHRYRDVSKRLGVATDAHPLANGLRIGKEDASDDGQYFHYLTKCRLALNCMSIARNDAK